MQRLELGFVEKASGSLRNVEETQPVIYEIVVKEMKPKKEGE